MINCTLSIPIYEFYNNSSIHLTLFSASVSGFAFSIECDLYGHRQDPALFTAPFAFPGVHRELVNTDYGEFYFWYPGGTQIGNFVLTDLINNVSVNLSQIAVRALFGFLGDEFIPCKDIQTFLNTVSSLTPGYYQSAIVDDFINFIKQKKYALSKLNENIYGYPILDQVEGVIRLVQECELLDFDIYEKPLDNVNVYQTLNGIVQAWSTQLSSDDKDKIKCIEEYNRNFILFHQNELSSSNDSTSPSSSSSVDLSIVNNQLTKIADSLNVSVESDPEDITKSITEVLNDKQQSDLIQVNTTEYPIDFKRQSSNSLDFTE